METATPVNKKRKQLFTSSGDEHEDVNDDDDDGTESASENISLSQMKKKSRRIKSLDHPSDPESVSGTPTSGNAATVGNRYVVNTQCGNFRIFLSLGFYLKSIMENLEVLKTAFLAISGTLNFVNFVNFSHRKCKNASEIKILSLSIC